jgi:hypothetical protein
MQEFVDKLKKVLTFGGDDVDDEASNSSNSSTRFSLILRFRVFSVWYLLIPPPIRVFSVQILSPFYLSRIRV